MLQDGFLELAPQQKEHFPKWKRISEICKKPTIVYGGDVGFDRIRQSVVGDCSFLSSLVVASFHEKRFGKPLITSAIHPRNGDNIPVYNPSGKYSVKLHMNGIPRKVVIDDYLPISQHNQLLCAHSSNESEFWVSLLEKAYMKLLGGYNFPGSDGVKYFTKMFRSCLLLDAVLQARDVHALTGWIPEIIEIQDPKIDAKEIFDRLNNGLSQGRCLITTMSKEMSEDEVKRVGLVGNHAYAVLDMREIDVR